MSDLSSAGSPAQLRPIPARRVWTAPALCGDVGPSQYATERRYVTCEGCKAEIEKWLEVREEPRR